MILLCINDYDLNIYLPCTYKLFHIGCFQLKKISYGLTMSFLIIKSLSSYYSISILKYTKKHIYKIKLNIDFNLIKLKIIIPHTDIGLHKFNKATKNN